MTDLGEEIVAKITYVQADGIVRAIEVPAGHSVMEGAVRNDVQGIDADCGGACACGTCHVYIDPEWVDRLAPRSDMEEAMIEFAEGVEYKSRLSCQITVNATLDGLIVRLPPSRR